MSAHDAELRARQGTAEDVAILVRLYAELDRRGRGEVLEAAANALAAARVRNLKSPDGGAVDPQDWLTDLAEDTCPHGNEVAFLIDCAAGEYYGAREDIFQEGPSGTVLSASEDVLSLGEWAYNVYMSIRANASSMNEPPDPAKHFGIEVAERDFEEFDGDEWVVNKDALRAEIRRLCVEEFAAFVAQWRSNFFESLIAGTYVQVGPRS